MKLSEEALHKLRQLKDDVDNSIQGSWDDMHGSQPPSVEEIGRELSALIAILVDEGTPMIDKLPPTTGVKHA